jgi:hypothetical protein
LSLKYGHFSQAQLKKVEVSFYVVTVNCLPDFYRLSDYITEGFISVKKDNCTGWFHKALSSQQNVQIMSVTYLPTSTAATVRENYPQDGETKLLRNATYYQ